MKFTALLAFAVLLAACTAVPPPVTPARPGPMMPHMPQPAGLRFTVEPRIAAPGSTVTLVLDNGSAHRVGYNLCASSLEQLHSGTWRQIPEDKICTTGLRVAAPGQGARYPTRLPASLGAGTHRFSTRAETELNGGARGWTTIHSETFTVR